MSEQDRSAFGQEDILNAIYKAVEEFRQNGAEPNTITTKEYAKLMDLNVRQSERHIAIAIENGSLQPAMIGRVSRHGFFRHIQGYRLIPKEVDSPEQ